MKYVKWGTVILTYIIASSPPSTPADLASLPSRSLPSYSIRNTKTVCTIMCILQVQYEPRVFKKRKTEDNLGRQHGPQIKDWYSIRPWTEEYKNKYSGLTKRVDGFLEAIKNSNIWTACDYYFMSPWEDVKSLACRSSVTLRAIRPKCLLPCSPRKIYHRLQEMCESTDLSLYEYHKSSLPIDLSQHKGSWELLSSNKY